MRNIPLVPNAITAFGLTCGLFVIFKVNMVDPGEGTYEGLLITMGVLLLAAIADVMDGAVARAMKAESDFGSNFDSLADAVTFGVAPSVIVLKSLSQEPGTALSFFGTMAAIIFSLCGVLRLVRFNVTSQQAKGNEELLYANKKQFTGLPIPAGAAALVSLNLLLVWPRFQSWWWPTDSERVILLTAAMFALGYFMVSRWKFPSIKTLQVRVASFRLVLIVVTVAVCLLFGLLYLFPLVFVFVTWGYLLIGLGLSILRRLTGRRMKGLAGYDPGTGPLDEDSHRSDP